MHGVPFVLLISLFGLCCVVSMTVGCGCYFQFQVRAVVAASLFIVFHVVVGCLSQVSSRDSRGFTAIHVIVAYHIHASIIFWCHHARFSGSAWLLCRLLDGSMFRRLHGKLSGTMFIDSFIVYACLYSA